MHPILFHVGSHAVHSYGVMILAGFLTAVLYSMSAARRLTQQPPPGLNIIKPGNVWDAAKVGFLVGILGTRVIYVLVNWPMYSPQPIDMLKVWDGGLSFVGAPLFSFAYLWWYCRRNRFSFLAFADICAPGFAIAHAIGRIGCFLAGCCYGRTCDVPWATRFHPMGNESMLTAPCHPTQLYASAANLFIFLLLDRRIRLQHRNGEILLGYLLLYLSWRFIEEELRKGATAVVVLLGLTPMQLTSIVLVPVISLLLVRLNKWPLHPTI
jgi:phosphatidylglycerol:prolipoprotein diacylglycerol transferase